MAAINVRAGYRIDIANFRIPLLYERAGEIVT